jgi:ketosteroid isomerase-like protein
MTLRAPWLGLLLHAAIATAAPAQATPDDSTAVARAVAAYHDALARGDSAAALELLAPDAVILEAGGRETLAEYRSHHLAADIAFARAVPSRRGAVHVTLAGSVAWAASTSETQGSFNGRPVDSRGAELMVLTRSPSGWRIRAIHWSSRSRPPAR